MFEIIYKTKMIFSKQNLIFISMSVFIICHQTTATGDASTSTENGNLKLLT